MCRLHAIISHFFPQHKHLATLTSPKYIADKFQNDHYTLSTNNLSNIYLRKATPQKKHSIDLTRVVYIHHHPNID